MKNKEILEAIMHEVRCPVCGRLLLKCKMWGDYVLQTICPRCKNKVEISKIEKKATKK